MKPQTRNIVIGIAGIVGLCLCACIGFVVFAQLQAMDPAVQAERTATARVRTTGTAQAVANLAGTATEAARPTKTPIPTDTPKPTDTPTPIPSETPTATSTLHPGAFVGTGDSVHFIDKPEADAPMVARITYTGDGSFVVQGRDLADNLVATLVDTEGDYVGLVPIDWGLNQFTAMLEIHGSGSWTIEVLKLPQLRELELPSTLEGNGDDVFIIGRPKILRVDAKGQGPFKVYSYSAEQVNVWVDEVAPYNGFAFLDKDASIVAVHATGAWTIDFTR